ncbi:MAG: 4Fe-4S cluster-binding domain-containing protein, partial [Bacteroidales bacterium]|nr:4Fe-4S cluster-binding domain-containing protein [Bacteroidales bacterium]
GYVWEEIITHLEFKPLLENIDVLVDGRFILEQRDISLLFRGSPNQRIIDVKASLNSDKPVTLTY